MQDRRDFDGKVAIVTGASQGLGLEISRMLGVGGATVVMCDIKPDLLTIAASTVADAGGRAVDYFLDVRDWQAVDKVVREALESFGQIDFLINNAGVDVTKPFGEITVDEWCQVLDANLRGAFFMAKAAWPHLVERRGHVVNIASTAAKRAWTEASAYHSSKWGLLGFSHALHAEARREGVKVTAVIAGGMKTPFILDRFPDIDTSVLQDPANVAEAVRFVLTQPPETVVPELMILPMKETSWP